MIALGIGDLLHNPEAAWLNLHGEGLMPGLLGAVYDPGCGKDETLEERITLILKGTHAEIAAFMTKLEDQVALANRYTDEGVGVAHYLRIKQAEEAGFFTTRMLQARLAPKPNSLAYHSGGSLGVELIFTRPNHFDGEQVALPLSNVNGTGVTTGLSLNNHNDSVHDNFFYVDGDDLETDLPAPLRLEISNSIASGETKDLWIGAYQYNRFNTLPQLTYEGESGSGGTDVSDASASAGAFKRLDWSDTDWSDLLSWTLTSANLTRFQGRSVMPIVRLANAHAYDDLQLKLVLRTGDVVLYEGAPGYSLVNRALVQFAPFRLPTAQLSGTLSTQAQTLHLVVKKNAASSYSLDVDFIQLLPLDSFSHYQALVLLGQGDCLVDDAFAGTLHGIQDGYEAGTHIPVRQGHFIRPAHAACFVVMQTDGDDLAPIERMLSVKAWYRPRKRVL